MARRWMRRTALACGAFVVATVGTIVPASAAGTVEGAGSSFPQLEIEQWRSDVAKKPYSLKINYVSSGSTFGRQQYIQGSVDFGVSDIPFQPDEIQAAAGRPYTYVTISAGGVGFMYNLRDTSGKRIGFSTANGGNGKNLKLTPRTVCRLLSEPNMQWNDPEIAADNPDISLPAKRVQPVLRADGSGTGFVVQEYCIATAPDVWAKFVDYVKKTPVLAQGFQGDAFLEGKPSSRWPVFAGQAAFAGDGVANVVATDTSGDSGITYVEAGFAEVRGFPNALVKNAAGVFHYPESGNVNTALKYARQNPDRTVTLDYTTPDQDAYFPSSYSYAIVPTKGMDASKGKDLATFLNYAVLQGQAKADALGYAPLSKEIVEISLNEIVKIPGAPPKPSATSFVDGSANAGGGSSGGGVTTDPGTSGGGGATTGGNTGGASGGSTGGATGGASGGGTTATGGAATAGGGSTGGTARTGTVSGGSTTGGTVSGGGSNVVGGATGASGTVGGSGATGRTTNANGVQTQVAGVQVTRSAGGNAALAGVATQAPSSSPSNAEVLVTLLQGAALCGAAAAIVYRRQRSKAAA